MCPAVLIGNSPRIWTRITRPLLVSKDRRHIFETLWVEPIRRQQKNVFPLRLATFKSIIWRCQRRCIMYTVFCLQWLFSSHYWHLGLKRDCSPRSLLVFNYFIYLDFFYIYSYCAMLRNKNCFTKPLRNRLLKFIILIGHLRDAFGCILLQFIFFFACSAWHDRSR